MKPTVSVIIPTYNRGRTIVRAVRSAFNQTIGEIEVIVVDDASDDDTISILGELDNPQLNVVQHAENRGGSAARNTGIDAADGKYIAFLDSDDEWKPTKLEYQVDCIESRSTEWVAVYCGWEQIRDSRVSQLVDKFATRETGLEGSENISRKLLLRETALGGASTLLVRRDVANNLDGFDEEFQRHQDWEFILRLLEKGKLAYVDKSLVRKYDTGKPSCKKAMKASERYREKFQTQISLLEQSGYDVHGRHDFNLAKYCFSEGKFRQGSELLLNSTCPHLRDALGLCWAFKSGLRKKYL